VVGVVMVLVVMERLLFIVTQRDDGQVRQHGFVASAHQALESKIIARVNQ
jgi:hypothetical protein